MFSIAKKLQPFSHTPGTECLLPGTSHLVKAFPTLVEIRTLEGDLIKQENLDVKGPLKRFTMMQDLERGCVTIFSELYKFHILPDLNIVFQKHPGISLEEQERLSLGSHKKQEWEAIKRRRDLREIFPLWFRLGSLLQLPPRQAKSSGMFLLLDQCRAEIDSHRPETIVPAFLKLFLAGFRSMLVPRLVDEEHQGILPPDAVSTDSPLYLLQEGAELIRSLFLRTSENEIAILPNLPPEFFAGRMLNLATSWGTLDLEWTKKSVRRLIFRATVDGVVRFHFPSGIKSFRLCKEKRISCGDSFEIKSNSLYLLDQFQK